MNIVRFLLESGGRRPGRPALVPVAGATGPVLTYAALDEVTGDLATELRGLGVSPGDRVVVQAEKSLGAVCLALAVMRSGAVLVPLNPGYSRGEVEFLVGDCRPTLVIGCDATVGGLGAVREEAPAPGWGLARLNGDLGLSAAVHADPRAMAGDGSGGAEAGEELAAILYTSGTTGRPKGAMITHGNLVANARALVDCWRLEAADVLLHALPVFHVHGLFVALHTALAVAAEIHLAPRFDAGEVLELLPGATVYMGVPTHYRRLLGEPGLDPARCASMRLFTCGSAPLDIPTFEHFRERTGHVVLERYGMTEAGIITSNPYGEPDVPDRGRVAGTVGFPLPGVDVRICDDRGRQVAPGEVGVLRARGPNVFAGYWGLPERTAEALTSDGWLISGDHARRDDEGRITLVGRDADLVIVGGYNVYPAEVERVLAALPGIAECAVVGVPHADLGEGVVACLVAEDEAPDESRLVEGLRADLADYKRPRRFHWLDELPRNAMGKVRKDLLRQRFRGDFEPPPRG